MTFRENMFFSEIAPPLLPPERRKLRRATARLRLKRRRIPRKAERARVAIGRLLRRRLARFTASEILRRMAGDVDRRRRTATARGGLWRTVRRARRRTATVLREERRALLRRRRTGFIRIRLFMFLLLFVFCCGVRVTRLEHLCQGILSHIIDDHEIEGNLPSNYRVGDFFRL